MPSQKTIMAIVDYAAGLGEEINLDVLREGLEVARLHRQVEQVIENDLAAWGLTARQIDIIEALYHRADETLTPAELSDEVGLTRSAMTSALDSLEKLGHTVRAPHPTDRRMVTISLTPSGREFIGQRLPERYRRIFRVVNCLSSDERRALLVSYGKVLDLLAAEAAKERE